MFKGDVPLTLIMPAVVVTLVFFAILFGVPESEPLSGRKLDAPGFVVLTIGLLLITGGLRIPPNGRTGHVVGLRDDGRGRAHLRPSGRCSN